jgi:pyroglutamyl-peptidase
VSDRPLRVLLTGFEPFGGEQVNPSQRLVEDLARESHEHIQLDVTVLPVDIRMVTDVLEAAISTARPDVIVLVGQAAKRDTVCLETTAFNQIAYGNEVDNGGASIQDAPVEVEGPERLHSTLPLEDLEGVLAGLGHPVRRSDDAGRYLCNHVLYTTLHRHPDTPCAFVHVPFLPEQAERRALAEPSLPLEVVRACLRELLTQLPRHLSGRPHPRSGSPGDVS